jgi:hypothetical protein
VDHVGHVRDIPGTGGYRTPPALTSWS